MRGKVMGRFTLCRREGKESIESKERKEGREGFANDNDTPSATITITKRSRG